MKRNNSLRLISLIVCAVMLLTAFPFTSFAGDEQSAVPVIYVPGFMSSAVYKNLGTDKQESVFPPETNAIFEAAALSLPAIAEFSATRNWDGLIDAVVPLFNDLLGDAFCDSNGNVKDGTGVDWSYPSESTVRASRETTFHYDWRLSPVEIARQLHEYVEYVKSCTASSKVSFICHSYGNCVGMTYVALFGTDDLEGFVCNSSAFLGETYNGELMTGNLQISGKALCNFLRDNVFASTEYEQAGNTLCDLLELLFVTDAVENNANYSIEKINDRASKELLLQWFGKWASVWAMVPDESYAAAREFVFDSMLADEDCSGLEAKLDEYDELVRGNREAILSKVASELNFGVVVKYNKQKVPVTNNPTALTDNNIDVRFASFGATCADYGSTLPKGYTQANHTDINYISPDNMIDASTCMFPERTWFIKNMGHSEDCEQLDELFYKILTVDGFTVTSDENYPQFMIFDGSSGSLMALNDDTDARESVLSRFFSMLMKFRQLLIAFLKKLGVM